jgi:hypothetical protein
MERFTRALLGIGIATAIIAPSAQARDFTCDASAVRLQLGSTATIEPVTANRGGTSCKAVKVQTAATNGPISGGSLLAQTSLASATDAQAIGGVGQLSVGQGALAGIPLPTLDAINAIPPVTVPIPALDQLPPFNLPSSIDVDIRPAVQALLAGLPNASLLDLAGSVATANAACDGSTPKLTGSTQVAGLKVLGQTIPTDQVVQQALTLYNGQTIDPSQLDLSKVVLPSGLSFTDPLLGTILQGVVGPVVHGIPPISLPASLLNVSIKPSSQTVANGGLTQQGLSISLSVLGQNVLSAVVGEARISSDSVTCVIQTPQGTVAPLESITKEALSCSSRRLALLDVLDRGNYVSLSGAANTSLAGELVAIRSLADGRVVAHARVSKAGLFHARAPLPPARFRDTNRARYMAIHGSDKSLNLKLHRRMVFTALASRHGKVVLTGLVTKPHATPRPLVVVRQRLTCRKQRVVARVRPDANGRFRVTVKAPRNGDVGVYRATTIVAYPGGDAPDFRTYTLPGLVRFAR